LFDQATLSKGGEKRTGDEIFPSKPKGGHLVPQVTEAGQSD